jgi:hypothetical protein
LTERLRVVAVQPAYNAERTLQRSRVSSPCNYFPEASSIEFASSLRYGLGVLATALLYRLNRWGIVRSDLFTRSGRRLRAEQGER